MTDAGCPICARHAAGRSHVVAEDEQALLVHFPPELAGPEGTYLGHLSVETRRHTPGLPDLTPPEAASVGRLAQAGAAALRDVLGAEHVNAAVIGHAVDHFHLHVMPRHPGTPREFWFPRLDEWPDVPRGDPAAVAALVQRLRLGPRADAPAGA